MVISAISDYPSVEMTENRVWKCEAGDFTGTESDGCIRLKGIRYASAERHCPPVSFIYPEGVHECNTPSPYCFQNEARLEGYLIGIFYKEFPQSEDCLRLSITMPSATSPDSKLPVMVWFHGGSYKNGGCENFVYDRDRLAREQNVIVVGVNYRLGLFGFVRDRDGNPANNGLLDCIEALRWIKRNIQSLGGDPDRVTIFGQSSGADICRAVMLSEGTEELYKRAIIQSPPLGTYENRKAMDRMVLEEFNRCPVDSTPEEIIKVQDTILSHVKVRGNAKQMVFGLHFGVHPLPPSDKIQDRMREISEGHEILIGSNTREAIAYVGGVRILRRLSMNPLSRKIVMLIVQRYTDGIFRNPTKRYAEMYAECGGTVYLYDFFWMDGKSLIGACHGSELSLIFGANGLDESRDVNMGLRNDEINDIGIPVRKMWADFARNGTVDIESIDGVLKVRHL